MPGTDGILVDLQYPAQRRARRLQPVRVPLDLGQADQDGTQLGVGLSQQLFLDRKLLSEQLFSLVPAIPLGVEHSQAVQGRRRLLVLGAVCVTADFDRFQQSLLRACQVAEGVVQLARVVQPQREVLPVSGVPRGLRRLKSRGERLFVFVFAQQVNGLLIQFIPVVRHVFSPIKIIVS